MNQRLLQLEVRLKQSAVVVAALALAIALLGAAVPA